MYVRAGVNLSGEFGFSGGRLCGCLGLQPLQRQGEPRSLVACRVQLIAQIILALPPVCLLCVQPRLELGDPASLLLVGPLLHPARQRATRQTSHNTCRTKYNRQRSLAQLLKRRARCFAARQTVDAIGGGGLRTGLECGGAGSVGAIADEIASVNGRRPVSRVGAQARFGASPVAAEAQSTRW
jgi:hypothetical protein